MSISLPSKSKGTSVSTTSTPDQYAGYFHGLNDLTGGRLNTFATTGTPKLTAEQIQAYGGLGATRRNEAERGRARALEAIGADANLSVAQRQRSTQLTNEEAQARLDAIAKETEAGIGALAQYNNELTSRDLELLIKAYYGGKGQDSSSKTNSLSLGGASYT